MPLYDLSGKFDSKCQALAAFLSACCLLCRLGDDAQLQ
jgi:hypothetical protein